MQQILEHIVGIANDLLWSKLLIVLLLSLGIYFTFRLKFLQVRMLKEMVRVLREGAAPGRKTAFLRFKPFASAWRPVSAREILRALPSLLRSAGQVQSSGCGLSPLSDQHQALWKAHWLRFIK